MRNYYRVINKQSSPESTAEEEHKPQQLQEDEGPSHGFEVDSVEAIPLLQQQAAQIAGHANPLEALLGGAGGFPPVLDMRDADDETLVELAIAISLQADEAVEAQQAVLQGLQQVGCLSFFFFGGAAASEELVAFIDSSS